MHLSLLSLFLVNFFCAKDVVFFSMFRLQNFNDCTILYLAFMCTKIMHLIVACCVFTACMFAFSYCCWRDFSLDTHTYFLFALD